jgi:hypothetical protein
MDDTLNRILLAAYGLEGTDEFAAHTAIRLANSADCELHLVYIERLHGYPAYAPISVRHLEWELHEGAERAGLERLWELDRTIRIAGGTAPQDRSGGGRSGWLGRGVGGRPDRRGHSGWERYRQGINGQ